MFATAILLTLFPCSEKEKDTESVSETQKSNSILLSALSLMELTCNSSQKQDSGLLSKVTKLVTKDDDRKSDDKKEKKEKEKGRSHLKHSKQSDEFIISGPTRKCSGKDTRREEKEES
jgi:hypothetical protein